MNHFEFTGPAFLVFYLVFSTLVIVALVVARRMAESSDAPKIDLSDPYLIAYLRGGEPEALRVATVALIDKGLLVATGSRIKRADSASPDSVRRPIERELLRKFRAAHEATSIYKDHGLLATCKPYEQTLRNAGLLPNEEINRARFTRLLLACFLLGSVALVKISIAFSSGRSNVGFLIALTLIAVVVAKKVSFPRLTERGKALIADLRNLYSGLRERTLSPQAGGASIEPMMVAAVFGVGALATANFAFTRELFPRSAQHSGASCASASCGSTCGSSGGGSCSGGGCGGGCGGCGG